MNKQMLELLCQYLCIDTAHPNPAYGPAITLLQHQAEQDGFTTQEILLPSGRTVLVITAEGSDATLPSLVLNHHMDVVPAEGVWKAPPFGGAIVDGMIIGRGVQDMKGVGIVHYAALKTLKDEGQRLRRTVHLVAVPDEEIGGFTGTGEFVKSPEFKSLNVGYVLDEGLSSGRTDQLYLKVSERKPMQVKISADGCAGHGSELHVVNAIHELVQFLEVFVRLHKENQAKAYRNHAGLFLSTNITSLQAGVYKEGHVAYNAIPSCAHAIIDIRVPSGMKMHEVKDLLDATCKKFSGVQYEVLKIVQDYERINVENSSLFAVLASVLSKYNIKAVAHHFEASTDARFYTELGITAIGFTPFSSKAQLHAVDEALAVDDFNRAIPIMRDVIEHFCGERSPLC